MNGGENSNFGGSSDSDAQSSDRQRHGVIGSRRYRGPSDEQKYAAATNLANNPNTPEFFGEAIMANTAAPQPRKSHKKLIIIIGIVLFLIIVAIIAVTIIKNAQTTPPTNTTDNISISENTKKAFNRFANQYLTNTDSDAEPAPAKDEQLYADRIVFDTKNSSRIQYFESLNQRLSEFTEAFNNDNPDNAIALDNFKSFYYYFVVLDNISEIDLMEAALAGKSKKEMDDMVSEKLKENAGPTNYRNYASSRKKYLLYQSEIIYTAVSAGCYKSMTESDHSCISNLKFSQKLAAESNTSKEKYQEASTKMMLDAQKNARDIFSVMEYDISNQEQQ